MSHCKFRILSSCEIWRPFWEIFHGQNQRFPLPKDTVVAKILNSFSSLFWRFKKKGVLSTGARADLKWCQSKTLKWESDFSFWPRFGNLLWRFVERFGCCVWWCYDSRLLAWRRLGLRPGETRDIAARAGYQPAPPARTRRLRQMSRLVLQPAAYLAVFAGSTRVSVPSGPPRLKDSINPSSTFFFVLPFLLFNL